MAKIKTTLFVEEELISELYIVADRMLWSKSAAMELAIKKFLEHYGNAQLPTAPTPTPAPEAEAEAAKC